MRMLVLIVHLKVKLCLISYIGEVCESRRMELEYWKQTKKEEEEEERNRKNEQPSDSEESKQDPKDQVQNKTVGTDSFAKSQQSTFLPTNKDMNLDVVSHHFQFLPSQTKRITTNSTSTEEELVPIRLDVNVDNVRIQDTITWNLFGMCELKIFLNLLETRVTPEQFAETFCLELNLPQKFEFYVAATIRRQMLEYQQMKHNLDSMPGTEGENIFVIRVFITFYLFYFFNH